MIDCKHKTLPLTAGLWQRVHDQDDKLIGMKCEKCGEIRGAEYDEIMSDLDQCRHQWKIMMVCLDCNEIREAKESDIRDALNASLLKS